MNLEMNFRNCENDFKERVIIQLKKVTNFKLLK